MKDFEWDETKNATNLKKHGIDFLDAIKVFHDENRIEEINDVYIPEIRHLTIGMIKAIGIIDGIVIFLVYTERAEKKRIISARRASKKERERYADWEA